MEDNLPRLCLDSGKAHPMSVTNLILDAEGIFAWKVYCLKECHGGMCLPRTKEIIIGKLSTLEECLHEIAHTKHPNHGPEWSAYLEELKSRWMCGERAGELKDVS